MRHCVGVAVACECFALFQPLTHQRGVEPALNARDVAALNLEANLVLDIAAIGKNDHIARLEHNPASGAALVRKGMDLTGAPMIKSPRLIRHTVLTHNRKLAARIRKL